MIRNNEFCGPDSDSCTSCNKTQIVYIIIIYIQHLHILYIKNFAWEKLSIMLVIYSRMCIVGIKSEIEKQFYIE